MDKDYEKMIRYKKADMYSYEPDSHTDIDNSKIFVVIRKRKKRKFILKIMKVMRKV